MYTRNSQHKSVKKRAAALCPSSAHFTSTNGGPDDAAAAGAGMGGGDGSGWQPDVIPPDEQLR